MSKATPIQTPSAAVRSWHAGRRSPMCPRIVSQDVMEIPDLDRGIIKKMGWGLSILGALAAGAAITWSLKGVDSLLTLGVLSLLGGVACMLFVSTVSINRRTGQVTFCKRILVPYHRESITVAPRAVRLTFKRLRLPDGEPIQDQAAVVGAMVLLHDKGQTTLREFGPPLDMGRHAARQLAEFLRIDLDEE